MNKYFFEKAFPDNGTSNKGMSLLDYFAGKVLRATMTMIYPKIHDEQNLETIRNCYRMAEMMMKVRKEFMVENNGIGAETEGLEK